MFAERQQDVDGASLPVKVRDAASRFLARAVREKVLTFNDSPPMVTFTFDDVAASACEIGARILEQHSVRGTFYVAGGGCGAPSPGGLLASMDQLRTIWANGHEIGCHTYSHAAVSRISLGDLGAELDRNRSVLANIDGDIAVRNFAYPYGDLSIRTKRYLEGRFDSCRSVHAGINSGVADLGSLKASPLENASVDHAKIAGQIAETARRGGWLIFYSHDVAENPGRYGVSPELLEWAVGSAQRAGCVLTTVADGLELIHGRAGED